MSTGKTLGELAVVLQADLSGSANQPWRQLVSDSRRVQPGDVFIAVKGAHADGHRFISDAIERGAAALIVAADHATEATVPLLRVADPETALMAAARRRIADYQGKTVAITGSYGKTTCRHVLASLLQIRHSVWTPIENRNTPIGLAMSLMTARGDEDYWVVEMGTSSGGEIPVLAAMFKPQVAMVTTVEPVHIANFPSFSHLIAEKASIFGAMTADDTAIVNIDQPWVEEGLAIPPVGRLLTVSEQDVSADLQLLDHSIDAQGKLRCRLRSPQGEHVITMPLLGRHHRQTVLNVCALLVAMGERVDDYREAWAQLKPFPRRMERVEHAASWLLIDDGYNANPGSVRAAIDVLADQPGVRVLVLGDMGELGELAVSAHEEIGRYAADRIDRLYVCGNLARSAAATFGKMAYAYDDKPALAAGLLADVQPDWKVLVKGSFNTGMDEVVKRLATGFL